MSERFVFKLALRYNSEIGVIRLKALRGHSLDPSRDESQRGQSSIMMGLMMMTFLFFFCFVVNVGMLVNAKINLQNAADLAAYAGAATQARQLNTISYLNYEMRRQYKKFLFRYYVVGNMAQKNFPTSGGGNFDTAQPYRWSPNQNLSPPIDYGVPAVCIIFNSNDNFCQVGPQAPIPIPPGTSFDAISDALNYQTTQLELARQNSCAQIGNANLLILQLWLWNTSPDAAPPTGTDTIDKIMTLVDGLTKGMGLIPRELLLKNRIITMKNVYLNQAPQTGVTLSNAKSLQNSPDPHRFERTIQAYMTAFNTLGDHTFSTGAGGDTITLDELQAPTQLAFLPSQGSTNPDDGITANFDTYALFFVPGTPGQHIPGEPISPSAAFGSSPCLPVLVPQTLNAHLTVGFAKDPSVETYYAIRLRAQAQLLFNPWAGSGGLTLTAYSAAKPFGSRIGPNLQGTDFVASGATGSNYLRALSGGANFANSIVGAIPYLPIYPDEIGQPISAGRGWASQWALGSYLAAGFPNFTSGQPLQQTDLTAAYQVAMAPTPSEVGLYNMPSDFHYGSFYGFSGSQNGVMDQNQAIYLWAPLVDPAQGPSSITTALQSELRDMLPGNSNANTQIIINQAISSISNYVQNLPTDTNGIETCAQRNIAAKLDDQECESANRVRLANPFKPRPSSTDPAAANGLINLPFMVKDSPEMLTSWNSPNDPGPGNNVGMTGSGVADGSKNAGRMGYSVKFVSFASLLNPSSPSSPKGSPPRATALGSTLGDENVTHDLNLIQH